MRSISSGTAAAAVDGGPHHRVAGWSSMSAGLQALAAHVGDRAEDATVGHRDDARRTSPPTHLQGSKVIATSRPGKSRFVGMSPRWICRAVSSSRSMAACGLGVLRAAQATRSGGHLGGEGDQAEPLHAPQFRR